MMRLSFELYHWCFFSFFLFIQVTEYLYLNSVNHELFYYKTGALANKIYIVYIYKLKHSTSSFFILHIELVNRNE